jgi:S-adenosylmethionine-diacylglycerol 3-amino-3-carboxypropyl transferase
MSAQLIADAVRNAGTADQATVWDRIFAFWFRRLVYTQIWEDPEADLAALQLPLGATVVTISSGGCNAMSYLTAQPAQVYAVDLNEAHLALLKLKLAGTRAFSNYQEFWQFFGEAASPANARLYRERLRPLLDPQTPIGTSATSSAGRGMPISRTASIGTACSGASSVLRIWSQRLPGSILKRC